MSHGPQFDIARTGDSNVGPSSTASNQAAWNQDVELDNLNRNGEEQSNHSSGITPLPPTNEVRNTDPSDVVSPSSSRLDSSRGRKGSKMNKKETGLQSALAGLGVNSASTESGTGTKRPQLTGPYGMDDGRRRHSRNLVWLVAVVVFILALAIILGAVLGTFVKSGPSSPYAQSTGSFEAPTTATATQPAASPLVTKLVRPTQKLTSVAVTGWTVSGTHGYNSIWLFWQNHDGYLSRVAYNSSTGNWTGVTNFAKAKNGTPVAAATVNLKYYAGQNTYSFPAGNYQASVVYLDEKNYLNEWTFLDNGPEGGQAGLLNEQKAIAHEGTQLGFYWPQLVYQSPSGDLRAEVFECRSKNQCWNQKILGTGRPSNGTRIVTSPSGTNLSSTVLFYQEESGRFVYYTENQKHEARMWQNDAFSTRIPSNASIASFSTTRPNEPDALNTYLLWQDVNGTIQISWTDSNDGWRGPMTDPAFSGADNNTAITCLTGPTFPGFPLQAGTSLSRCYFQTGLMLREVSFDGGSWDIVGTVPIGY